MKLGLEEIKAIAQGAVRVEEKEGSIYFHRFTEEQEQLYLKVSANYFKSTRSTAGIKLQFRTNSERLFLKANLERAVSRHFFSFDVFADGECVGHMDNFSDVELPKSYAGVMLPLGVFSKEFELPKGEKLVTVYFPFAMLCELIELSLDDGATIEPVRPKGKLLAFGDSITHGYDALRSSSRYAARLAEGLGLEEVNKGVGGERFSPWLAKTRDDFIPEVITVAYGTNDWSGRTRELFTKTCSEFYTALSETYPTSKIFAITPIWRKNYRDEKQIGTFEFVADYIKQVADGLPNVTAIEGFDLVPHDPNLFGDLALHPNDEGFTYYYQGLLEKIKSYL